MTARPILMSGPMVHALLDGRKTQTRRIVKPSPGRQSEWLTPEGIARSPKLRLCHTNPDRIFGAQMEHPLGGPLGFVRCPYGQPGDLLWVREAWSPEDFYSDKPPRNIPPGESDIWFWADGNPEAGDFTKPKPSIHMPRWASRLTLELTEVRVERLQDISPADAIAEGILVGEPLPELPESKGDIYSGGIGDLSEAAAWTRSPVEAYSDLWKGINGLRSWAENSWVWVLGFRVHQQNVDAFLKQRAAA